MVRRDDLENQLDEIARREGLDEGPARITINLKGVEEGPDGLHARDYSKLIAERDEDGGWETEMIEATDKSVERVDPEDITDADFDLSGPGRWDPTG